jgi:ABC-2 type transport system permease protein
MFGLSLRRTRAVVRKEIQHILRDRTTFILVMLTPTALMLLMAYALTVDLKHIPIAVFDQERSQTSYRFVQQITAGEDLDLTAYVDSLAQIDQMLVHGDVKAAIVIAPTFSQELLTLRGLALQIIIDGTEPESGSFAVDHVGRRAEQFVEAALANRIQALGVSGEALQPIDLRVDAWFNPGLRSRVDLVPGLISLVLGFPALSVGLTLAHEREHRTLEQLMATPIRRSELLIGKMIPYLLVGMASAVFIPILAMLWFDVPFNGNFILFLALSSLFLFAILSMGIIIGVFMRTQAAALALSFLLIFFPGFFLTGIFFPLVSMPEMVRLESLALPGTHYAIITRAAFLTSAGLGVLWPYAVMLLGLGVAFTGLAALFFRKKLA